jgi:hypothetical protein
VLAVCCCLFGDGFWGVSRYTSGPRYFHKALRCNLKVARLAIRGITFNGFAASTADPFWFCGLDFRKRWATLCNATILLSKRG